MKLVDAVVPAADLVKTAKDWIKAGGKAKAPWDVEGFRLPGGQVYSKAGMMTFPAANAIYRRETYDNYPAARAILQVVYEGLLLPFDRALTVESRHFAHILRSPEAAAMIRSLFVSMQDLNKGARRPASVPPVKIKKVGIIGAGFMGAGIASVSAQAGIDVVLIDRDQESADKGKAHVQKSLTDQVNKGRMIGAARDAVVARITATPTIGARRLRSGGRGGVRGPQGEGGGHGEGAGGGARRGVRLQHLDAADHVAGGNREGPGEVHRHSFLLAGRAHDAGRDHRRQEDRRPGARDRARFRARDPQDADRGQRHARLLRQPLRAQLHPGRPSDAAGGHSGGDDREHGAHGRHAGRSALAQRRDRARSRLEDRARRRSRSRSAGGEPGQKKLLEDMVEKNGRLGRKNGKGFYDYPQGAPKRLWPGLADLLPKKLSREQVEAIDVEELKQRFLVVKAVEAARTFEEGVVTDVREADVGSILGWGFAPYSGGTLSYIDMMGTKKFVELCERLEKKYGPRFKPGKAADRDGQDGRQILPPLRARQEGGVADHRRCPRPQQKGVHARLRRAMRGRAELAAHRA